MTYTVLVTLPGDTVVDIQADEWRVWEDGDLTFGLNEAMIACFVADQWLYFTAVENEAPADEN